MLLKDITLIDENYQPREHQHLLIEDKFIKYIGDTAPKDYTGPVYNGNNKVVLPGFFNTHCHMPMTLIRGYGEGLPLHRWLTERMFPFEALMTEEDMYWGTLLAAAELIKSGTVSVSDMYLYLDFMGKALTESGLKANLCHGTSGPSPDAAFVDTNGYNGLMRGLDYVKGVDHDRIIIDAGLHAEYTSHEKLVGEIAAYAKEHGLRLHLHLSETKKEHEECKQRRGGKTPAQYFESLGAFEVPVTAAHCVWVEEGDMEILSRNGVTAVHCPSSNLKLGSGIAPVRRLLEKGVRVAIGTDGAASNNNLNMLEEVTLASVVQKGANQDPMFLSTADVLTLACKNGALSQGREDCGAIKVGNRADLVVYDLDKPHLRPVFDVLSNVLYSAQASDVAMTVIDGQVVYRDGELTGIDEEKVKYHADRIAREKQAILEK